MNASNGGLSVRWLRRLLAALAAFGLALAHAAPKLEVAAGTVGGLGNGDIAGGCTTWGNSQPLFNFFGSGHGVGVPVGGITACGYAGQLVDHSAVSGTAAAAANVGPVILGNPGFAGFYTGSATAQAQFGGLRLAAQGSFSGGLPGGPTALFESASAAILTDQLTLTSPLVVAASPGFVAYRFKLDGSLSAPGTPAPYYSGELLADLGFQHGAGPGFGAAHLYTRRGELGTASSGGAAMSGWTSSIGQVSGSSVISTQDFLLPFPIVFGQAWDFRLGLAARSIGESTANFLSTAQLVGVDVFDAQGTRITDFTLTAASGTDYIGTVPEPPGSMLMLIGAGLLLGLRTRRRAR